MSHQFVRPILAGVVTVVVILLVLSLLLSTILHFTSVKETSIEMILLPSSLLTLFLGGVIAGYKSGAKGWYVGGLTGFIFIILTWLLSFLGFDLTMSFKSALLYFSYLLVAVLGGMIGVNLSPHKG